MIFSSYGPIVSRMMTAQHSLSYERHPEVTQKKEDISHRLLVQRKEYLGRYRYGRKGVRAGHLHRNYETNRREAVRRLHIRKEKNF